MKKSVLLVLAVILVLSITLVSCGEETFRYEGTIRNQFTNEIIEGVDFVFDGVSSKTNIDGMFAFEGIKPGQYDVIISKDGFEGIEFTIQVDNNMFEELTLIPGSGVNNVEEIVIEKPVEIPEPIPPGEVLSVVPDIQIPSDFSNFKVKIGAAPESVTTEGLLTVYVDGDVEKVVIIGPTGNQEMVEILHGDLLYIYDVREDVWMKHSIDPDTRMEGMKASVKSHFDVLEGVLSGPDVIVSELTPTLINEKSYSRLHVSGLGKADGQSFDGEVYILDGVIVGFDGRIADGKYNSYQDSMYILVSDIGNVEKISIPENAEDFDFPTNIDLPDESVEIPEHAKP